MKKVILTLLVLVLLAGTCLDAGAKKKRRHRKLPGTEQVWTALGGTYAFVGDNHYVAIDFGVGETPQVERASIDSEECTGTYDETTHLIVLTNEAGEVVFEGKIYNGGNLLKGKLHGKPVALNGACGA